MHGRAVVGDLDPGPETTLDMPRLWLAWFDRWLRGSGDGEWPRVRYFAMGSNAWREADAWPPSDTTPRSFSLGGDGSLTLDAFPEASSRTFRYDPADPTPALATLTADPLPEWNPRDIGFLAARSDVLVYTSEPFTEAMEIAGPVQLRLHASSSAVDTDFAAIVADVGPDGRSILVSQGILRASFRESLIDPTPLVPGECYDLAIELADLGHVVLPGHRLQVIVSSCLFPYYHPNPNTGARYGDEVEGEYVVASQTVFSGGERPSRLEVYVRPR
jgi:putative CocE/NonD family hydrolase